MLAVKGLKAGQYAVYEPADKKSTQTQVLRIRQAFDLLGKPWPLTRPVDGGKATGMRILSRKESLNRYPSQEKAGKEAGSEAPAKKKAARKKR
jgi:hypothetical protein